MARQSTVVVYDRALGQVAAKSVAVVTVKESIGRRSLKAWSTVKSQGGVLQVDGRFAMLTFAPPLPLQGDVKVQVGCILYVAWYPA